MLLLPALTPVQMDTMVNLPQIHVIIVQLNAKSASIQLLINVVPAKLPIFLTEIAANQRVQMEHGEIQLRIHVICVIYLAKNV